MSKVALVYDRDLSPGRRAMELMKEARAAGDEHVLSFLQTLELACRQATEIASGGEVYPAGVRDLASRFAENAAYKAKTIYAIMGPRADRDMDSFAVPVSERPLSLAADAGRKS